MAADGVSTLQRLAVLQAGLKKTKKKEKQEKRLMFLKAQRPNVWCLLDTTMLNDLQRALPVWMCCASAMCGHNAQTFLDLKGRKKKAL